MTQRYARRMKASQAELYRELVKQEESLEAAIALNEWALEQHIKQWTEQADEGDPAAMSHLSTMIGAHTDVIRKLVETRHKIEHDNRLSWTPRQVQNFIMQVAGIIDLYEKDGETRRQIAAALEGLVQNRKFLQWPDEDVVEQVISRVYDRALLEP